MPLFDFVCPACGIKKEVLVKQQGAEVCCDTCHNPMQKQVGKSNFELKGSGWFKDGY
jgi:putative FmdB family regulatory protein